MTQPFVAPKNKVKILIADDVQETRRNTRLMLATVDAAEVVAIASNGAQAVQLAKEHHPDIVLLDINMPEMDGLTAFRHIIQTHPDTGCVIISAEKDPSTLRTAMSLGVQEYLIKPFTVDELEVAVKRVYDRVKENRKKIAQLRELSRKKEEYLKQLANEYAKTRRTDEKAMEVFEQLAENPQCEVRWLQTLAMIYIVRQRWDRLKILAEKVDKRMKSQNK
ncbi:MAG TPA: response regulator [Anaerolineales bacterium]|nr:response regulator [Anaerolineales bacterium]